MENRLRALRLERGMTQQELALRARTTPALLTWVERYGYLPGPELQERIARALDVTPEDIWPLEVRDEG
jgi:transcriptional regulator with XRE-family HTH domain